MDAVAPSSTAQASSADASMGSKGTLVVVAMETLWPANHGGRVDRWNRFLLLRQLGWRLIFVGWTQSNAPMPPGHDAAMAQLFDRCIFFPNRLTLPSLLRRVTRLHRHSPHMSARLVPAARRHALAAELRGLGADAIMADGLYGSDLAVSLADDLDLPLFYRSHNIEHRYMADQAAAARGIKRKIATKLASLHVERAETDMMRRADWVFDISADDMREWADKGITRASWLPPLTLDASGAPTRAPVPAAIPWDERPYDLAYLGNLNTPNNVEGLVWFVRKVLPELRKIRTDITILLAGSNPSPDMRALVAGEAEITLLANPVDGLAVRQQGRVLINPVLRGSGVNVKSVEMLMTDSPVVTTRIGVQGLDKDTQGAFAVTDDVALFARHIDTQLRAGPVDAVLRQRHRDRFGIGAATALSDMLQTLVAQHRKPVR